MQKVLAGERLPRPENCPKLIYDKMLEMWDEDLTKRPDFKTVHDFLATQIVTIKREEEDQHEATLTKDGINPYVSAYEDEPKLDLY